MASVLPFTLIPAWSLPKQYSALIVRSQQQGGVIERGDANQINVLSHIFQMRSFIREFSLYQQIESHFLSLAGRPFLYQGTKYRCPEHQWTIERNLWIFEATFEKVN